MSSATNLLAKLLVPLGRVLIGLLFVPSGVSKVSAAQATAGFMASGGLPESTGIAIAVGVFEIVAGLALMVGLKARWAALALAAFTMVASLLFHAYWSAPPDQQFAQQLLFMKNLAVLGALLFIGGVGPGSWSVDALRAPATPHGQKTW